jgi:hypothetical protein
VYDVLSSFTFIIETGCVLCEIQAKAENKVKELNKTRQAMYCTYNVTLRGVRATVVVVEKQ